MKAFVLVGLKHTDERHALDELKALPEIKDAYVLFGEWDLLLNIESTSPEALGTFVMDKIRSRDDVKLTSSLIVAGS
ncbi:Lrp/AsnC family transcriptional regulator [Nanoarchaeota archaeon]